MLCLHTHARLSQFNPDVIFISAGFDAHKVRGRNGGWFSFARRYGRTDHETGNLLFCCCIINLKSNVAANEQTDKYNHEFISLVSSDYKCAPP